MIIFTLYTVLTKKNTLIPLIDISSARKWALERNYEDVNYDGSEG